MKKSSLFVLKNICSEYMNKKIVSKFSKNTIVVGVQSKGRHGVNGGLVEKKTGKCSSITIVTGGAAT